MNLLDCTFRDGGYYNNWEFSKNELGQYLEFIKQNPINIIEIGFRFTNRKIFFGPYAFSSEDFLKSLKLPRQKKVSVMINAKDFYKNNNLVDSFFKNKKDSVVDIVRIAVNYNEYNECRNIVIKLKKLGYLVGFNLMKANYIDENYAINVFKALKSWSAIDVLYFADSLGCMEPTDVAKLSKFFCKYWNKDFGIHAHNNKGLAVANTIAAIENGASYADSTILGMGRGAGNAATESLLIELKSKKVIKKFESTNINSFHELNYSYKWGYSPYYHYSAVHNIHPTYVQTLIEDARYDNDKIFDILKRLSTLNTTSFNSDLLAADHLDFYNQNYRGELASVKIRHNGKVLIIGSGNSIVKNKEFIKRFINNNDLISFSLNNSKEIEYKYIDYFVISHLGRINIELKEILKTKKKIIAPPSVIKKFKIPKNIYVNYGLKITDKFISRKSYCESIYPLALAYALLYLSQTKVNTIYLSGIDGYEDESKNEEINQFLTFYKNRFKKIKLFKITPSKFRSIDNFVIY